MTVRTFIAEQGYDDSNGFVLDLNGMQIPSAFPITKNFDKDEPIVGIGFAKVVDGKLIVTAELPDSLLDGWPAIQIEIPNSETDCKILKSCNLISVAVCSQPNVDPEIKTIREQCTNV